MPKFYDITLWEYIQNPGKKLLDLKWLADIYFDLDKDNFSDITKKQKFGEYDSSFAWEFEKTELEIIKKTYQKHKEKNIINEKILKEIEIPLMEVLKTMELSGVKIDVKKLKEIWELLKKEISEDEKMIHLIAGEEFNIKSPKQVGTILFEKLWLPHWKKTKTGYSVDTEVLEWLSEEHAIAKHILNYRSNQKLLSTYVVWLIDLVDENDKIHTTYNQALTSTWRLSSTNPNLQNIPASSSGIASTIREAFIPFEDWDKIMAFDYSQIEVRLLAIMSDDETMCSSFNAGVDIHSNTGYFLFWDDDLTGDQRKVAKAVNFWVIYWISPFGLAKMIWISQSEAREYIAKFYDQYPKIWDFFQETISNCEKNGYVETIFWRKRYIAWINDRNKMIKQHATREAINMPIQWTSADIIKIAMIKIQKFIEENNLKSCMIMQVHDELVFNVKAEEVDVLKENVLKIMENIIEAKVKLKVDFNIWDNWKEAK